MGVSYNRNTGLALGTDLALLVVDAGISVRTRSCSDPHLKWDTGFLGPASKVRRMVSQTFVWSETQSFSDPRLKWSAKLLRSALEMGYGVAQTLCETQSSSYSRWMGRRVT